MIGGICVRARQILMVSLSKAYLLSPPYLRNPDFSFDTFFVFVFDQPTLPQKGI